MFDLTKPSGIQTLSDGSKYIYDATKRIFKKDEAKITSDATSAVDITKVWTGSKLEYDNIQHLNNTIYFVKDQ